MKKMITNFLVAIVIALSCLFCGDQIGHYQDRQLPPKTIIHETRVTVDSKTTSKAEANAYSVNIFKDETMFKTLVLSTAGTNIEVSMKSNTSESWKTNNTKTNK